MRTDIFECAAVAVVAYAVVVGVVVVPARDRPSAQNPTNKHSNFKILFAHHFRVFFVLDSLLPFVVVYSLRFFPKPRQLSVV